MRRAGNLPSAHKQNNVPRLQIAANPLPKPIQRRLPFETPPAFPHRRRQSLAGNSRNGILSRRINFGQPNAVRVVKARGKLLHQPFGPGVAMRLKYCNQTLGRAASDRLNGLPNFRRVMRVVVHHAKPRIRKQNLLPPPNSFEPSDGPRNFLGAKTLPKQPNNGRRRIGNIRPARKPQSKPAYQTPPKPKPETLHRRLRIIKRLQLNAILRQRMIAIRNRVGTIRKYFD